MTKSLGCWTHVYGDIAGIIKMPATVRLCLVNLDVLIQFFIHEKLSAVRISGFSKSGDITVIKQAYLGTCTPTSGEIRS
jgi:hypothetical protein